MEINAPDRVVREEGRQRLLRLCRLILPERPSKSVPRRGKPLLVGVRILDDQPIENFGMAPNDSKAHRPTVILHKEPIMIETPRCQKLLHRFRDTIERVVIGRRIRAITVTEALIVRVQSHEIDPAKT